MSIRIILVFMVLAALAAAQTKSAPRANGNNNNNDSFSGERALAYARDVVAFGPRYLDSPGHAKIEQFLKTRLKSDNLEIDEFTAQTPVGPKLMRNYIAKFPGSKPGIIVIAGHYDTLYGRNDFVGANDGGSSTGLPLALCDYYRARTQAGKKLDGFSVWIVFLDGEEAIKEWSDADSIYGARHLAAKWKQDGTATQVKAFILADMIGDKDLSLEEDSNSSVALRKLVYQAAEQRGTQSHFFRRQNTVGDDHTAFSAVGIPVVDLIDFDYGYHNAFWHTSQDTMDKLSAESLQIVGDVIIGTVQLIDQRGGPQ
ncbi:MAG: M28 family peptidase [Acidobacteriaceae bacterium]